MYQKTQDTLSAMWHYNDTESNVKRAWFSVGTYPYGSDVNEKREVNISSTLTSYLPLASVSPDLSGIN